MQRATLRARVRRHWARMRLWRRLCLLLLTAALLALGGEVLHNLPALATAGLTPEPLPLSRLRAEADVPVTQDAEGFHLEKAAGHSVDLVCDALGVALQSVTVELAGEGVVTVALLTADQANAYVPLQVYSEPCVASDPALSVCRAALHSAGSVGIFRVRLKPSGDGAFTLRAVTLNAPLPFVWQSVRMGLAFGGWLLLLCALCLREVHTPYASNRWAHRLWVVLPLVGLMAFAVVLGGWIAPDQSLGKDLSDAEAAESHTDAYAVLFETLRAGRLDVDRTPDPGLLALKNPYDASERTQNGANFPFDYALYNGRFYLYYGPAPVLTVYAPYHLLTSRVPNARDASLWMALLAIGFTGWAVCGLARRYAQGASVLAVALCCVTAVFADGALLLFASADFYYLAELSFVAFAAGAAGFALYASCQPRRGVAVAQAAGAGLCFALAAMSRPSGLPMLALLLAVLLLSDLRLCRAGAAQAGAFLLPAVLGVGALLWYNMARFGSAFDFGVAHQLTVTDIHWRGVDPLEWARALYHYLVEPYTVNSRFPYLSPAYHALPTTGRYVFTLSGAGVLASPLPWLAALAPLCAPRGPLPPGALRRERRLALGLPLLASLPLMLVAYGLAGAILRYTFDYRLFYALAALAVALPALSDRRTQGRRALALVCLLVCLATVWEGFQLLFDNERDYILNRSPQVFYALQRMFFPY